MEIIKLFIQIIAAVFCCLAAAISILLFLSFRWPAAAMWGLKVYASALSLPIAIVGVLSAIVGLVTGSLFISLLGGYVALIYFMHIIMVSRPPNVSSGFSQAFGVNWERSIPPEQKVYFLPTRLVVKLPDGLKTRLNQNIAFASIPGTDRDLLCDVWQPPATISASGAAFIYLHGSAFYILDKDFGTRPFFRLLAAQGHVILDVAYRLAPETDIMGMVHDVKRAIAWMKERGSTYGVNADRIVVGGGSAGGSLALMAAYTSNQPQFTPKELEGKDLSVCAVISLYGPTDLAALYYHTNQHLTTRLTPGRPKKAVPTKMPQWMVKQIGKDYHRLGFDKGFEKVGTLAQLLGGHPDESPESYALLSPITHVHAGCPPTLLIHGEHDIMAPVTTTRLMNNRLVEAKVPTVMHILPQTDHGFDLALPVIAPAAHNAFYDVERFIALVAL